MQRSFTIRQLTKEFGVTARTLRFYEDEGLIAPERRGQTRIYSSRDRARIILILRGRRVGFSLAEIREILDLYKVGDGGAAQSAKMLRKFRERIVTLEAQREDIDHAIGTLREACDSLEKQLAETHPDLLPKAESYDQVLRARLDGVHEFAK